MVHEFDYRGEHAVIYQENGVTIKSFPALHAFDGPVGLRLEWNGLSVVFSSDTYPTRWYIEAAKGADVAVHECFVAVPDLVRRMNFPVERALLVGAQVHMPPPAFGKVMSLAKPRIRQIYERANKMYGTDLKSPF